MARDFDLDFDRYHARWHDLFATLAKELESLRIEPGEEVARDGRVIGGYFARLSAGPRAIYLVSCDEPEAESIVEVMNQQGRLALLIDGNRQAGMVNVILRLLSAGFILC